MDQVMPGALRRLREADIIGMAGLKFAALGQEYYRTGAVHTTTRQGIQLTGIVEVSPMAHGKAASPTNPVGGAEQAPAQSGRYPVIVEIQDRDTWRTTCSCNLSANAFSICPHAAALLYQWLAQPATFASPLSDIASQEGLLNGEQQRDLVLIESSRQSESMLLSSSPGQDGLSWEQVPISFQGTLAELLSQLNLSELRGVAREYDITRTGLIKQQLVGIMVETLKQPEVVRKVVRGLEKSQRQLLAALTLAGGTVTEEDLRGLFERFSLGYANQLQGMISALRGKALLFRTSFSSSHTNLVGSLHEVGWYVPTEIRAALPITVPVTPWKDSDTEPATIQHIQPYRLLEDLLLVARALDGYRLDPTDSEHREINRTVHSAFAISPDGLMMVPPPHNMPSPSLLESLQAVVLHTPAFLRFAIRLLRLVDILYKDDDGTPYLHILPNAARLLLSPTRIEVAQDLFTRWLTQPTYAELFDLQEEGLRLCCRGGPLGRPALRTGELETENSNARQMLVALLAKVPLNQWVSFSSFVRFIYRLNPAFLQGQHNLFSSPAWWLEQEEGRPLRPTQLNEWLRAEGRYIARLLRGPLHWWGISDLVVSNSGQLLAFRLTPLAGLFLQGQAANKLDTASLDPHDHADQGTPFMLTVAEADDLLISCSSPAWPSIELIEEFAEVAGVQAGMLRYRLTVTSLSEALRRGLRPAALLQLLQQHAGPALTPFLTQLERRIKNYGRVRLYTDVTLLEVVDTPVIRELSATTPLEEQIVRTIQPTMLILKKQGAERIVQDLKRRGQVPLVHEEEGYGAE